MSTREQSRREFLVRSVSGLGAAWVATNYSSILAAEEYVQQAARSGQAATFAFFTPDQAAEVEAMAAQIIPTDATGLHLAAAACEGLQNKPKAVEYYKRILELNPDDTQAQKALARLGSR